jgi:hypothetical protein
MLGWHRHGVQAPPPKMLVNGTLCRRSGPGKGLRGKVLSGLAPVIKDKWDVLDTSVWHRVQNAKCEVPILRTIEAFPKSAYKLREVHTIGRQMIEEILAKEKVVVEVGLEIWVRSAAKLIDMILVRIDDYRLGASVETFCDHIERVRGEDIVMIHQRDPVA